MQFDWKWTTSDPEVMTFVTVKRGLECAQFHCDAGADPQGARRSVEELLDSGGMPRMWIDGMHVVVDDTNSGHIICNVFMKPDTPNSVLQLCMSKIGCP